MLLTSREYRVKSAELCTPPSPGRPHFRAERNKFNLRILHHISLRVSTKANVSKLIVFFSDSHFLFRLLPSGLATADNLFSSYPVHPYSCVTSTNCISSSTTSRNLLGLPPFNPAWQINLQYPSTNYLFSLK